MTKTLRLLAALLIAVCGTAQAQTEQTVTLDCSTQAGIKTWTGLTAAASGATQFTSATYQGLTVSATKGTANPAFQNASDFRVYQKGGTLTFSVPEGGQITQVAFFVTTASYFGLTPSSGGGEVNSGSRRWSGNAQSVTFSMTKNNRFTSFQVTYTLPNTSGTEDANLSFTPATAVATLGEPFTAPVLSNPNGVTVRYESTDSRVATVDGTTGEVTLVGRGTATIKVISIPDATYAASEASYVLTVVSPEVSTFPYTEPFTTGTGFFYAEGPLVAAVTPVWNFSAKYGAVGSGYVNGAPHEVADALLISPVIDLGGLTQAWAYFDHYVYKGSSVELAQGMQKLLLRKEGETTWTTLAIPNWSIEEFVNSGNIDLTAYAGQKVQLALAYNSTTEEAPNWEVKNFTVSERPQPTVTIGKTGYATFFYGASALVVPAGLEAYTYKLNSGTGYLEESYLYAKGEVIPAATGLVLKGTANTTYTLSFGDAAEAQADPENLLEGSDVATTPVNDPSCYYYKLTTKGGTNVGFYWGNADGSAFANAAHKAYLKLAKSVVEGGAVKNFFSLSGSNDATTAISEAGQDITDAPRYNVAGQRVGAGFRGLVIQGGKKFVQ